MWETRSRQVLMRLEESLATIMDDIIKKEGSSASGYLRSLLIHDFNKRGLLSQELLVGILSGKVVKDGVSSEPVPNGKDDLG